MKKTLRTLNSLANEISQESLFSRGGTLLPDQIKNIFKKVGSIQVVNILRLLKVVK